VLVGTSQNPWISYLVVYHGCKIGNEFLRVDFFFALQVLTFYTHHMKVAFFLVLSFCQTFGCETCCIVTCLQLVLRRLVYYYYAISSQAQLYI
jgi:hypothetical protein